MLIFSIISSRYLYSWLVSKFRISITDFDDDFFTEETFFIIMDWWSTPFPLTEILALVLLLEDKWLWRESWNSVRAVEKWLWVCLTLYDFIFGIAVKAEDVERPSYDDNMLRALHSIVNMKEKVRKMLVNIDKNTRTSFWWTHSVHSARNLKSGLVWILSTLMILVCSNVRIFTHFSWTCWTLNCCK